MLFLLFINDISNVLPELKVKLFADDTNIFLFNRDINILFIEANLALEKINSWFNANKLIINIEKTHYCIFNRHNNLKDDIMQLPVLKLENKIIECVKSTKYLGITIDNTLTFKEHINNIISSVKKFCGIFYKFRSRLPLTCLKTIYFAMIHSQLNYGIEIYANTYNSFLEPLVKINNKILRILQNKPLRTPVADLYKKFNTLQITQLRDYNILFLVHRFVFDSKHLPEIYHHYFTFNAEIHTHNTRQLESLHTASWHSQLGKRNIKILGSNLWNSLPKSIRSIGNARIFKRKLKLLYNTNKL